MVFLCVPVIRISDNAHVLDFIHKMKQQFPDFHTIGTTAHKQAPIYTVDMTTPIMFMIGNETDGLCSNRNVLRGCETEN